MIGLFFLLGSVVGSFLTVVGIRLPKKQTFVYGRSSCPTCAHILGPQDLIPMISYLTNRGACRYCKEPISLFYLLMEFVMGLLWASMYVYIGLQLELVTAILFLCMLHIVVVSDLWYMIIPNQVLLFFTPLFLILTFISPDDTLKESLLGALVAFGLLYLIYVLSHGGLGGGDVKLFAVLGLVLGIHLILLTLFIACVLGSMVGGTLIFIRKIRRTEPIPFGPFIAVAAVIAYVYGEQIIYVYTSL